MIKRILIDEIKLNRGLDSDENLKELAKSLRGGQQVPILVLSDYTLVDGLRRVMALNTMGATEVDAVIATTFEEAAEALYQAHQGILTDRVRRLFEIDRDIKPLILERATRLRRKRMVGVPRFEWQPSDQPQSRMLMERALGKGYDKIVQTYRAAEVYQPDGWRAVLRDLENGDISSWAAYNKLRGKEPLNGNIRSARDQKQLVDGVARQLEAVVLALEKLAWPIVMPAEDRQRACEQLRYSRGRLSRILHLLEEAEKPNDE